MIEVRPFNQLGGASHGWLDAKHHFSFASYYDPSRMGWGALRVWNDDTIQPHAGFPPHPHSDMEIITYVRNGAISHRDDQGNAGRTVAGDVQIMSAGSGITHSEYNLEDERTQIFQLWILPDRKGGEPAWGARPFPRDERSGRFVTLASGFDDDGDALKIRAKARVAGATLKAGETAEYRIGAERYAYLVLAAGAAAIDGQRLGARDGAAIKDLDVFKVTALEDCEIVLVDVSA